MEDDIKWVCGGKVMESVNQGWKINLLKIEGTNVRKGHKDHYVIVVSPSKKKELGSFVVIKYRKSVYDKNKPQDNKYMDFLVQAKVLVDRSLSDDKIQMDQTLRNALGLNEIINILRKEETDKTEEEVEIEKNEEKIIEVYPLILTFTQKIRDVVSYLSGKRHLYFRTAKARIQDMEKNLLKIPMDSFKLLGCELGDKVICTVPYKIGNRYYLKELKVYAYDVKEPVFEEKFKYSTSKLKINRDIAPIFLDKYTRDILTIDELVPVCVRRNIWSQFSGRFQDFGLIFLISSLAIFNIFPLENTWLNISAMVGISTIISIVLVLLNIRGKLK